MPNPAVTPAERSSKDSFVIRQGSNGDGQGPLNSLTKSDYDFSKTQYPAEGLGSTVPSYVVFYINLPESSKYNVVKENFVPNAYSVSDQNVQLTRGTNLKAINPGAIVTGAEVAALNASQNLASSVRNVSIPTNLEQAGKVVGGTAATAVATGTAGGLVAGFAQNIQKKPKMQRIKEAIAIYMPDTVMHTYTQDYDVQSMTSAMADIGLAQRGGKGIGEEVKAAFTKEGSTYSPQRGAGYDEVLANLSEKTGLVGSGFTDFALRSKGVALNPQVELLFRGTANRSFIFEFKFQPKNQKETETIKRITYLFRRYAAPSLASTSGTSSETGAYFVPPGEFDIQYYFKNKENDYIGRISTCVLENIDINYSPAGQYATFVDGAPVEINLVLRFKEVDILTREMIDKGF
jgi:hypothetical protein